MSQGATKPDFEESDPAELIEEHRSLIEKAAESDTEAGKTARRLLAYVDGGDDDS